MQPAPAHLDQVGSLPVVETFGVTFRRLEQFGETGAGEYLMTNERQLRQLVAAGVGTPHRHHDGRIPVQDRHGTPQHRVPPKACLEFLVGRRHQCSFEWRLSSPTANAR